MADNFRGDCEVSAALEKAVEVIRGIGYPTRSMASPSRNHGDDLSNIEADREAISRQISKDVDILLLPTTTTGVPGKKDASGNPLALSPENTVFANYYGLPAISVPCGFDRHSLPLGLQIVAKPWDEETVLHLAHRYENATPWKTN